MINEIDKKIEKRNIELHNLYVKDLLESEVFKIGSVTQKDKLEIACHVANGFIIGHDKQVFFEKQNKVLMERQK
jgi:hypothetical protein